MTFFLPYVPPYHWPAMLAFLAARAVPPSEQVVGATYRRSLRVPAATNDAPTATNDASRNADGPLLAGTAAISNEPTRQALRVELSSSLAGGERIALQRLGQMFDVACDPSAVTAALGDLARADPGVRLPGAVDPFEIAARAILGQQVTVAAARTLATRLVVAFGEVLPIAPPIRLFPLPQVIAAIDPARLGELGIIRTRAAAIVALAQALSSGDLHLEAGARIEPTLAALTAIRGIGPWTAHYIAMRALGWTDAFPPGDVVVHRTLGVRTSGEAAALARRWQPWRAYAVLHLWRRSSLPDVGSSG